MMLLPSVFELYAVAFFLASCRCQSAPFRPKNKLGGGGGGGWKKLSLKPRTGSATRLCKANENNIEIEDKKNSRKHAFLSTLPSSFFSWEASIDGPTGVASSNERSGPFSLTTEKFSRWSTHKRRRTSKAVSSLEQNEQERIDRVTKEEEQLVVEMSRQFVDTWSDFLCRGSISLGILSCAKENNNNNKIEKNRRIRWRRKTKMTNPSNNDGCDDDDDSTVSSSSLMARFVPFPVKLLEFGKAVESSPSPPSPVGEYKKKDDKHDNDGLVVLGSWDIPLKGGTLILQDDESNQQSTSCSSDYLGKLTFAIAKKQQSRGVDHRDGGDDNKFSRSSYQIMTGIVGYRPWLAGGGYTSKVIQNDDKDRIVGQTRTKNKVWDALKANRETTTRRMCHAFYLSTQSMVHAYVTWRFHHAWRQNLKTTVQTTTTKTDTDAKLSSEK